ITLTESKSNAIPQNPITNNVNFTFFKSVLTFQNPRLATGSHRAVEKGVRTGCRSCPEAGEAFLSHCKIRKKQ
ncbi:MAG: hypothetical protein K2G29_05985, partial [Muribaculaceae bacterium]|nr:hypothetical protein [Muribaculaceae bacterium]